MKPALIQQGSLTSLGTQDFTDANLANVKGSLVFASQASVLDTTAAQFRVLLGMTDGTNNVHMTAGTMSDGVAGASSQHYISNTGSLMQTNVSPAVTVKAAVSAILGTGVRWNYTTVNATSFLESALVLGDTDIANSTCTATFSTTDTSKTVTHGAGGAPDIIIAMLAVGNTAFDAGAGTNTILGMWERGGTACGLGFRAVHAANPTDVEAIISADLGHACAAAGADAYTLSISNVTATTFDINRSASASSAAEIVFYCLRGVSQQISAKCGIGTTPTSTGLQTLTLGLAQGAQVLIVVPTRLQSSGSVITSDDAGSYGIGMACNNNAVTQQMATASTMKDNVASSVAKCRTTASNVLLVLDNTGAVSNSAQVNSWGTDIVLNHTAVAAAGLKFLYLAFSLPTAGSTTVTPSCGSLTMGGLAATELKEKIITPAASALSIAGLTPSSVYPGLLAPLGAALTITGLAPTAVQVGGPVSFPVTAGLSIAGLVPFLLREKIITPDLPSFGGDEAGLAPTILTEWTSIPVAPAPMTINGLNPLVIAGGLLTVTPGVGLVQMQGLAATIVRAVGQDGLALPDRGELDVIGLAPTIYGVVPLAADVGALSITGLAPSIFTRRAWHPSPNPGSRTWHAP